MSTHLSNDFMLNTSTQIVLSDGIGLVSPQILHNQVNSHIGDNSTHILSDFGHNVTDDSNYRLVPVVDNNQQAALSVENLSHLPGQDMSQGAQIVLLPTQNINLVANVPKQEQVQMILPNDVGYQLLTSIPNVSVLVPTNLLLTNGYILINNDTESSSQTIPLQTESVQSNETLVTNQNPLFLKQWAPDTNRSGQHHIISTDVEFQNNAPQQMAQAQECEYIALADTGTQTVLGAIPEAELNQTTHLINSNGQIVGIIGSDHQLSILQSDSTSENQVLIIDANEGLTLANGQLESAQSYDINTVLASTIAAASTEKTDPSQAKQWLKDSCIVNRALKALKKNNTSHHHHANRPHSQARRAVV